MSGISISVFVTLLLAIFLLTIKLKKIMSEKQRTEELLSKLEQQQAEDRQQFAADEAADEAAIAAKNAEIEELKTKLANAATEEDQKAYNDRLEALLNGGAIPDPSL